MCVWSILIPALVGVDHQVSVGLSERLDWANSNAFLILVVNAGGSNDVGHVDSSAFPQWMAYLMPCHGEILVSDSRKMPLMLGVEERPLFPR